MQDLLQVFRELHHQMIETYKSKEIQQGFNRNKTGKKKKTVKLGREYTTLGEKDAHHPLQFSVQNFGFWLEFGVNWSQ